jgi:hypothetical protein
LGALNGQKCEKAEAGAEIEPIETEFTGRIRQKRMAGVRQGDICGQILRNRILRTVCRHCRRWIYGAVSFWKPKEFTIRKSSVGDWRVFSGLQVEAMDDPTQELANKMIAVAGRRLCVSIVLRTESQRVG